MENLKIGEGPLKLNSIFNVIKESNSFPQLLRQWKNFGRSLGVKETKLIDMERKLGTGTLELDDIPYELLSAWKANAGSGATLKVICQGLAASSMNDAADLLEQKYWLDAVKSLEIKLNENIVKLGDIQLKNSSLHTYQLIYEALKITEYNQPIQLLKEDVILKAATNYYIQRTLSYMTQVDEKMFQSAAIKNHLFVVKGIGKHELATLSGYQTVDLSGNQLDEITVRFIALERDQDFAKICKITKVPVHLIHYENDSFYWAKSQGGLEIIQRFMKGIKNTYGENELMKVIQTTRAQAVSISDSPGMGKSFLLTNLASKFKSLNNSIVIIVILNEFVKQTQRINSPQSALTAIVEHTASSEVSKIVLKAILNNSTLLVDLFLDGYDEVEQLQLSTVDAFLSHVRELKNFRVFVTTRPHFKSQLENVLNVPSYEILPFDESNQIDFLIKYWIDKHGAEPGTRLENYARECLKVLYSQMTDAERGIAGIPLQCRILADVLGENAERASKEDSESVKKIKIASMHDMYKKLVDLKFKRLTRYSQNHPGIVKSNYINVHIFYAVTLLFPNWIEKFKQDLQGFGQVDENVLYSIGLIEKSSYMNTARFVHRTFAEFLLAGFLVKNMNSECVQMIFGVIFGGEGFRDVKPWHRKPRDESSMRYPVMAYFINMHVKDKIKHIPTDQLAFNITKYQNKIQLEDVCKAIMTCGREELESFLELSMNVLQNFELRHRDSKYIAFIRDRYFKLLPHSAVQTYEKVTLIKKVVEFLRKVFKVELSYHVLLTDYAYIYPWIAGCTPLHVAVYYGKYNIVTYLVEAYGNEITEIHHIFHVCVYNSSKNCESMILDKLTIIDLLATTAKKHRLNWLGESVGGHYPLMVENAHSLLLQRLKEVETGADVNTLARVESSCSKINSMLPPTKIFDIVDLHSKNEVTQPMPMSIDVGTLSAFSKSDVNFSSQDNNADTTILHAVKTRTSANISNFVETGANHQNDAVHNVAHAFMSGHLHENSEVVIGKVNLINPKDSDSSGAKPFDLLEKRNVEQDQTERSTILQLNSNIAEVKGKSDITLTTASIVTESTDVNHIDEHNQTAAHLEIRNAVNSGISTEELIVRLNQLRSKGFTEVDHKDKSGFTPLHLAVELLTTIDLKLLDFFHKMKVDFSSESETESVLFTAIRNNLNGKIIKKLLKFGANMYHLNSNEENALHVAAYSRNVSALKFFIDEFEIESGNKFGQTALHQIVLNPEPFEVKLLDLFYIKGANFNAKDSYGWPVFLYATQHHRNDILRKLLEYGADVLCFNPDKESALHVVAYNRNLSALEFLINRLNIESKSQSGRTPLCDLVTKPEDLHETFLDVFRRKRANFNATDNDGVSVLHIAIGNNQRAKIISKLLEYGADLYHTDQNGYNALHIAAYNRNVSAFKFLVDEFGIDSKNEFGQTPLHALCSNKDPLDAKLLDLFREKGANFDAVDNDGWSALALAIDNGQNSAIISKLIEYGTDLYLLSPKKFNALHVAAYTRTASVLELLIDKLEVNSVDESGMTPLHYLVCKEEPLNPTLLDLFHKRGADFNAASKRGSVLFDAIRGNQNVTIISKIIEYGGDPYYLNCKNYNALLISALFANISALEFLLQNFNFDIDAVDDDGDTPLYAIFLEENKDYRNVLKILLERSPKFDIKNKKGYTPLDNWIIKGNDPFPTLLELEDLLPITIEIASSALTALVCQEALIKDYLFDSAEQEREAFKDFFNLLIRKGGKLVRNDGFQIEFNNEIHGSYVYLGELDTNVVVYDLIKQANFSTEALLDALLVTKQYDLFQTLCIELTSQVKLVCSR